MAYNSRITAPNNYNKQIKKMAKQTAVKLIFEKFNILSDADFKSWMLNNYNQLFDMEKEQIVEAHEQGMICCTTTRHIQECDFEPYSEKHYNETYGGENAKNNS